MTRIPSPYRSVVVRTGERVSNGVRLSNEAGDWMDSHEDEFKAILGKVRRLKSTKPHVRLRDVVAVWCCEKGVRVSTKEGVFVDNSLWAAICRYLVLADPSLDGNPIRMRHSDVDLVGLREVEWLEVA